MIDFKNNMRVQHALDLCKDAHGDQKRQFILTPYYLHPLEVAEIVATTDIHKVYSADEQDIMIAGALLHDVLEDTNCIDRDIMFQLGDSRYANSVTAVVKMCTEVSRPEDGNRARRKWIDKEHYANGDRMGQTIKVADMISNSYSIMAHQPDFAVVYMREKAELLDALVLADGKLRNVAWSILQNWEKSRERI